MSLTSKCSHCATHLSVITVNIIHFKPRTYPPWLNNAYQCVFCTLMLPLVGQNQKNLFFQLQAFSLKYFWCWSLQILVLGFWSYLTLPYLTLGIPYLKTLNTAKNTWWQYECLGLTSVSNWRPFHVAFVCASLSVYSTLMPHIVILTTCNTGIVTVNSAPQNH